MKKISLILIGSELLDGKITDLNGAWFASWLNSYDASLDQILSIPDKKEQIHQTLDFALANADIIVISGGLGPTKDDITKDAVASYFDAELMENSTAQEMADKAYANVKRIRDASINNYHIIPNGFEPVLNTKGLAPGLMYISPKKIIILCVPGVPKEFKAMIQNSLTPHLALRGNEQYKIVIKTFGVSEEDIFSKIDDSLWNQLEQYGDVSSLPQMLGTNIHLSLNSKENPLDNKNRVLDFLKKSAIFSYIWSLENKSPMEVLFSLLLDKNKTISFAESCTGGLVSSLLTDIEGSSQVFLGSIISYDNNVKVEQLNVGLDTLKKYGAVSEEVAMEMVEGVQKNLASDVAISFSGIAGPGGGTKVKPVGLVKIAIAIGETRTSFTYQTRGSRLELKNKFATWGILKTIFLLQADN